MLTATKVTGVSETARAEALRAADAAWAIAT